MKLISVLGVGVVILLYALYEWPKIDAELKKEKAAFIVLSALGWCLAALLLFFPGLPPHVRFLELIYAPLTEWLDN